MEYIHITMVTCIITTRVKFSFSLSPLRLSVTRRLQLDLEGEQLAQEPTLVDHVINKDCHVM